MSESLSNRPDDDDGTNWPDIRIVGRALRFTKDILAVPFLRRHFLAQMAALKVQGGREVLGYVGFAVRFDSRRSHRFKPMGFYRYNQIRLYRGCYLFNGHSTPTELFNFKKPHRSTTVSYRIFSLLLDTSCMH